jgi:hypothetical protein
MNATAPAKRGHVCVIQKRVSEIRPAPENEDIYRPISTDDPEIQALADDIARRGVMQPLIISLDGFILAGHRRHVAAQLAGLETVPCIVEPIKRGDPEFLALLVATNQQRVKTLAESAREAAVLIDPDDAYDAVIEHRHQQQLQTGVLPASMEVIEIEGQKRRHGFSDAKLPFLVAITGIVEKYRAFWPLTDRSIHYYLLDEPPLRNTKQDLRYANDMRSYKDCCDMLARARLFGHIPFEAIRDETRSTETWFLAQSGGMYLRRQIDDFLKSYWRDLQQSQPFHVEIVGEKNTLRNIIHPIAERYCIPYTLGRGYASLPPRQAMKERFENSGKDWLSILMLNDYDPEGDDIPHAYARSMRDDFGIWEDRLQVIKVGLTKQQVEELSLPPSLEAKKDGSRYKGFVQRRGTVYVHELESVKPEKLQEILRDGIEGVLDMDLFRQEREMEKEEHKQLAAMRQALKNNMADWLKDFDGERAKQ